MALTKVTGQVVNTSTDLTVGVLTATTASFTGNVSVGGTLTYEDVTNVDSVGLITARNGIEVTDKGVQVGTGATVDSAAANTLTFLTNGSERLRINSDGLVTVGGNETVSAATGVQIENAGAALLTLLRNDLTISEGNTLGGIDFYGNDGGSVEQVAKISAVADGTLKCDVPRVASAPFATCAEHTGTSMCSFHPPLATVRPRGLRVRCDCFFSSRMTKHRQLCQFPFLF